MKSNKVKIVNVSNWAWFDRLNFRRKNLLHKTLKNCHSIFPESFSLFIETLLDLMEKKNKNSIILFEFSKPSTKYELIIEESGVKFAKNYEEFVFDCGVINGEATMRKYTPRWS